MMGQTLGAMRRKTTDIRISPLFFALLATLLLYEQKSIAVGCLAASLLHECGHLLVMLWRHAPPRRIVVGAFGMRIERQSLLSLSFLDDLLIALGGPLMNGLCCAVFALLGKHNAAAIHLLVALLNLLPIQALDGGEILRCCLYRALPQETAQKWMLVCSLAVVFPLGVLGFFVLLQSGYNVSLLVVDLYLILLLIFKRKD